MGPLRQEFRALSGDALPASALVLRRAPSTTASLSSFTNSPCRAKFVVSNVVRWMECLVGSNPPPVLVWFLLLQTTFAGSSNNGAVRPNIIGWNHSL